MHITAFFPLIAKTSFVPAFLYIKMSSKNWTIKPKKHNENLRNGKIRRMNDGIPDGYRCLHRSETT